MGPTEEWYVICGLEWVGNSVIAMNNYYGSLWRQVESKAKCLPNESISDCAAMHRMAWQRNHVLHAYDRYGRLLGMGYWRSVPNGVSKAEGLLGNLCHHSIRVLELTYFFSVPGFGRAMLRSLLTHMLAARVDIVRVPQHLGRARGKLEFIDIRRALRRLAAEPALTALTELHPVLAGKATESDADAVTSGAAIDVLSRVPRLAETDVQSCVQLINRARSAGHLHIVYDAKQMPTGLLVWARPKESDLYRLWQREAEARLHASELNAGGDLALLEYAALDASAVEEVLTVIKSALDADSGGLSLLLRRQGSNNAKADVVTIRREETPEFLDWFRQQLLAQVSRLSGHQCA
jgi:hypothetical protein